MTLFLTLLFFLTRLLHLLFWFFTNRFPDAYLTGTLAKELIEGLKIPIFNFMGTHYSGGNIVYGICVVPFFLLFGKSAFTSRLAGVFFQYGIFLTWHLFLKRFFGKREAFYASLLYLFSPPWFTYFAAIAGGAHAESPLFTGAALFLLYQLLYEEGHSLKKSIFLGLVCGLGSYYSYGLLVSVLSFLLFWCYEDRKVFQKKELYLFFLFFLLGFSPWFVYNFLHQFHGLDLIRNAFIYPSKVVFVTPFRFLKLVTLKLIMTLSFDYRKGIYFQPHLTLFNLVYYTVILLSYLMLYRFGWENRKTHFLVLFPFLYLLIASISQFSSYPDFSIYFTPLFPFFFAVIALGLVRLGSLARILQKVSLLILVALLAMGVKGELNLVSPSEFGLSLKYHGYSYRELGSALSYRYADSYEQLLRVGEKAAVGLPPSERLSLYCGLGNFEYSLDETEDLQKYFSQLKRFDKMYQPLFLEEMGRILGLSEGNFSVRINYVVKHLDQESQPYLIKGLVTSLHYPSSRMEEERILYSALSQVRALSPQNQRALAYALGELSWRRLSSRSFLEKIKQRTLEKRLSKGLLPLYYRGIGALMVQSYEPFWGRWPISFGRTLRKVDNATQKLIFWGAGFEAPLVFEDPFEYERMIQGIPPAFRETFKRGLQDRLIWGGRNRWIEF